MAEPVRDPESPLNDYEKYLVEKFFGDPNELPQKFKAWIADYAVTNGKINVSDIPSLKGEEWIAVGASGSGARATFANSWVNFDTDRPARFMKDAMGFVHIEGIIKSGTIGLTAFTLPSGYRPGHPGSNSHFGVDSNGAFGVVTVNIDGSVKPGVGNNTYVSLCGITFRAA